MNDEKDITKLKVPCEVYSRIVGYLRPVQNWNEAKRAEFHERSLFDKSAQQIIREEGKKK